MRTQRRSMQRVQLWIEAYAGMVGSMVAQAAEEAKRREGVAMAHSL